MRTLQMTAFLLAAMATTTVAPAQADTGSNGDNSQSFEVAIIGAGSSGIATCKALYDAGVPFDCFELSRLKKSSSR